MYFLKNFLFINEVYCSIYTNNFILPKRIIYVRKYFDEIINGLNTMTDNAFL